MNEIKKFLIKVNDGDLKITEVSVNPYMPINRFLDEVGYYQIDFFHIDGCHYICTLEKYKLLRTKILVTKYINLMDNIEIVNIENEDTVNMEYIFNEYINTNYIKI